MEKQSKTMEQIYREKYSRDLFKSNPLFVVEAIGYLTALLQFMPSECWAKTEKRLLLLTIKILLEEGVLIW